MIPSGDKALVGTGGTEGERLPGTQLVGTVWELFEEARALGLLGGGRIEDHVDHSVGFALAAGVVPEAVVDLGSGAGVPGLVLAQVWREARVVLLEGSERRVRFLEHALRRLALGPRVEVLASRAEEAARQGAWRGRFDVVVARAFGPPAATAECGAPFLRPGGLLVVSEPPSAGADRWPDGPLRELGLEPEPPVRVGRFGYVRLRAYRACPERFPRRVGVPARRPLFRA